MNPAENLICPITHDWLDDPVTSAECGHTFSRADLLVWLQVNPVCPVCRNPMDRQIMQNVARNHILASMANDAKAGHNEMKEDIREKKEENVWKSHIFPLVSNDPNRNHTTLGKLVITSSRSHENKKLLIMVVDKSGSMAGSPIKQAMYSVERALDLTYQHKQLASSIVLYSDNADVTHVDTRQDQKQTSSTLGLSSTKMGGTSFTSAFKGIVETCKQYSEIPQVTSATVIFLTDGEDSTDPEKGRPKLVRQFKTDLAACWSKPIVIHSIGFGTSYDSVFLNSLRRAGSEEGVLRNADPAESEDILSRKINSILNVVSRSFEIQVELVNFKSRLVAAINSHSFWVNLTGIDRTKPVSITFTVGKTIIETNADIVPFVDSNKEQDDKELWDQYYSTAIDQVATDIARINTESQKQVKIDPLVFLLLSSRTQAILDLVQTNGKINNDPNSLYARGSECMEMIRALQSGQKLDMVKMNDFKAEGKFSTEQAKQTKQVLSAVPQRHVDPFRRQWQTIDAPKRANRDKVPENVKANTKFLGTSSNRSILKWLDETDMKETSQKRYFDGDDTILTAAARMGRCTILKSLMDRFNANGLSGVAGWNLADICIMYGHWKCFDQVIRYIKPSLDGAALLKTCLMRGFGYDICAQRLIQHKIATVDDEMVNSAPTARLIEWLSQYNSKLPSLHTAIVQGLVKVIQEYIKQGGDKQESISWKPYYDMGLFNKPLSDAHSQVLGLLIQVKWLNVEERFETTTETRIEGKQVEIKEITCPFFIACEKGNQQLFNLVSSHSTKDVNWQNQQGVSPLWIAVCNRHVDIVMELIGMGANVNLANVKGDGPLVPCCQKGYDTLAELLISSGAKLDVYNRQRDTLFLIACRGGHDKVLQVLFNECKTQQVKQRVLSEYAEIDGLVPLLACAEQDQASCIRVCLHNGANLETRTNKDIPIAGLGGCTALHVAAYYGRLAAVKALVDAGAQVNTMSEVDQCTPLILALKKSRLEVARYLLKRKDVEVKIFKDSSGKTAVYYARMAGNEDILFEFFSNPLANRIYEYSLNVESEKVCAQILTDYATTLGCFDYRDVFGLQMDKGQTVFVHCILGQHRHLLYCLQNMADRAFSSLDTLTNMVNDAGISNGFWIQLMKPTELTSPCISNEAYKQIERLEHALGASNTQSKLICSPNHIKNHPMNDSRTVSDFLQWDKMTENSENRENRECGKTINISRNGTLPSLLGWIDKCKSNKLVPNSRERFDVLLHEARIHLIQVLASGQFNEEKKDRPLDPLHILSLFLYTANRTIFQHVNLALSGGQSIWTPLATILYHAIDALSPYRGEVYRVVNIPFTRATSDVGVKIQWNNFAVCSQEYGVCTEMIGKGTGIIYIVNSRTGRDISRYAKSRVEKEVVFLPGTMFVVTHLYRADDVALGQKNIRINTFSLKDKDMSKVLDGKASIIVELDEVDHV